MAVGKIRLTQLDTDELSQKYIRREEVTNETFDDSNYGFVFSNKATVDGNSDVTLNDILLNVAKKDLGGFRQKSHHYDAGDIVISDVLPSNLKLVCVSSYNGKPIESSYYNRKQVENYNSKVGPESAISLITETSTREDSALLADAEVGDLLEDGEMTWLVVDALDGLQVGDIKQSLCERDGYLVANGQQVNCKDYPRLYRFAKDNKLMLTSMTEWQKNPGLFCLAENGKMVVPDLRATFIRNLDLEADIDTNRKVGELQYGTIVGGFTQSGNEDDKFALVVNENKRVDEVSSVATVDSVVAHAKSTSHGDLSIDSSYVGVVRPRNIAMIPLIKY